MRIMFKISLVKNNSSSMSNLREKGDGFETHSINRNGLNENSEPVESFHSKDRELIDIPSSSLEIHDLTENISFKSSSFVPYSDSSNDDHLPGQLHFQRVYSGPVPASNSHVRTTLQGNPGDINTTIEPEAQKSYPDMTTFINNNTHIRAPLVEEVFLDKHVCNICGKHIMNNMKRHMRTHESVYRFHCFFPKSICNYQTKSYNRPYEYKRHLLHRHFKFDEPKKVKKLDLNRKLSFTGSCPCGENFIAKEWIDDHLLTKDKEKHCRLFQESHQ